MAAALSTIFSWVSLTCSTLPSFLAVFRSYRDGIRELFLECQTLTTAMVDHKAILILKEGEKRQLKSKIGSRMGYYWYLYRICD